MYDPRLPDGFDAVVRQAQRPQIPRLVRTSVAKRNDVVHVHELNRKHRITDATARALAPLKKLLAQMFACPLLLHFDFCKQMSCSPLNDSLVLSNFDWEWAFDSYGPAPSRGVVFQTTGGLFSYMVVYPRDALSPYLQAYEQDVCLDPGITPTFLGRNACDDSIEFNAALYCRFNAIPLVGDPGTGKVKLTFPDGVSRALSAEAAFAQNADAYPSTLVNVAFLAGLAVFGAAVLKQK